MIMAVSWILVALSQLSSVEVLFLLVLHLFGEWRPEGFVGKVIYLLVADFFVCRIAIYASL